MRVIAAIGPRDVTINAAASAVLASADAVAVSVKAARI
jgi:hypothetical protein